MLKLLLLQMKKQIPVPLDEKQDLCIGWTKELVSDQIFVLFPEKIPWAQPRTVSILFDCNL